MDTWPVSHPPGSVPNPKPPRPHSSSFLRNPHRPIPRIATSSRVSAPLLATISPPPSPLPMSSTVCSMCGDVGFPDKLFRCARCRCRSQHSYCTNYYGDAAPSEAGAGVCDWCLSNEGAPAARKNPSPMQQRAAATGMGCGKLKVAGGGEQESGRRGPKVAVRRYKLLKDVLC
ncbi:uncharacterized protein LOC124690499 [Lolium rigidum]|uniref:uncharacterized protein LOC124690499 n=1 Tax=Lolium rigidum TaxID=89674 RepID=UPI001F5C7C9E|nr:uncharacterized protein LOC124690499 [Lolium rigidum]